MGRCRCGTSQGITNRNLLNRFQVFSGPKVWLAGQFVLVYCIVTVAKKDFTFT